MSHVGLNRSPVCAGVRMGEGQENGADNNRRGQDKSGGPVGAYAVVVVRFSASFATRLGAVSGLKLLRLLAFPGTTAASPSR